MATSRRLTTAMSSLSISSPSCCIRNHASIPLQLSHFSTTPIRLGGPVTRMRRERIQAKLRKSKARAEQLRIERAARADPIIGHSTPFTKSLLRPREILAQSGTGVTTAQHHTRSGPSNWPLLTNFGIGSEDSLTLAVGAKVAERKRVEKGNMLDNSDNNVSTWTGENKILYHDVSDIIISKMKALEKEDMQKKEVMSRILDLTNGNSKAVINANIEKAIIHFARHEGDTGSPEVQGWIPIPIISKNGN